MEKKHPQTPPRLRNIYAASPVYFVTFCTHARQRLLNNEKLHASFVDFVQRGFDEHHVAVGRYVIMPDHIHLFVRGPYDFRLSIWVNQLKGFLTKRIRFCSRSPVANADVAIWQRGFFDHVLRSHESYSEKWKYVEQNPVRAGLVGHPAEWPYAGECAEIRI